MINAGEDITLPKQPVLGGVGGNPKIWMQLLKDNNEALTDEIFIGRCVQGAVGVDPSFLLDVVAAADVETDGCTNSPGPVITLSGGLTLSGVKARFIFRNADKGPHQADAAADVQLVVGGSGIQFPKSPHEGGVGGNPLIYLQFRQGSGDPIGGEILLGRCNKL
jgi:hypothetical protein